MDPLVAPPDAHHAVDSDGEIAIWALRPDVVIEQGSGTFSLSLARCLTEFYRSFFEPGKRCRVFVDFERFTDYTREAREHMNAFLVEHLQNFSAFHFLIGSKLVALGINTAKVALGDDYVLVYTERQSFLRSLQDALAER